MTVTAIKCLLHPCHVMQLHGKEHVMCIALVGEWRNYWIFSLNLFISCSGGIRQIKLGTVSPFSMLSSVCHSLHYTATTAVRVPHVAIIPNQRENG